MFKDAEIDEECSVTCPGGVTTLRFSGQLVFVNSDLSMAAIRPTIVSRLPKSVFSALNFEALAGFMSTPWLSKILAVAMLFAVLAALPLLHHICTVVLSLWSLRSVCHVKVV